MEGTRRKDRCGAEGEDRLGGAARAAERCRPGLAIRGAPKPDVPRKKQLQERAGAGVRRWHRVRCRGHRGAGDREATRQNRPAAPGAGFFGQEVRQMSAPDRRALVDRDCRWSC